MPAILAHYNRSIAYKLQYKVYIAKYRKHQGLPKYRSIPKIPKLPVILVNGILGYNGVFKNDF